MSQRLLSCDNLRRARKEKWLRKNSEPFFKLGSARTSRDRVACDWRKPRLQRNPYCYGSEAEMRDIAVADVHLGIGHQPAVNGRHEAAEQAGGGRKGDSCGPGHCDLSGSRGGMAAPS